MEVTRKPISIKVKKIDDEYVTVDTPFYSIDKLPRKQFASITAPFGGMAYQLDLECDDKALEFMIQQEVMKQSTWRQFLGDDVPAYRNYFTNVHNLDNVKNIKSIKNSACGKTILFIGGGPSVFQHLDEIKRIRKNNDAIIVAGGSGVRLLAQHSIKPDLVLAFDPFQTEWDYVFSELAQGWTKDIPLVTFFGLHTGCYNYWLGPKLVIGGQSGTGNTSLIDKLDHISEGGVGVSTCMMHLANYMNCEKLVYLGIDLAYQEIETEEGTVLQSHADCEKYDNYEVLDKDGKPTTHIWLKEKAFLEHHVVNMPYKCFNASTIGLTLNGWDTIALKEIVDSGGFKCRLRALSGKVTKIIKKNVEQVAKDLEQIEEHGLRPRHKTTLAYHAIIAPYDYLQLHREMWTRFYNMSSIRLLAGRLAYTIRTNK